MTPIELLQAGKIAEFNARRGQRVTLDLFAADLANLPLAGVDLSRANLEKADLSGSDLTGANLAAANLAGADLTGATLDRVVAVKARLREAYLGEARAEDAELTGADLSEADLTGLYAPRARLVNAKLREAVLTNAQLPGADLTEARLGEADLRGADLTGATLVRADLGKARCDAARFERADLSEARMGGASLKGCHLAQANLKSADLTAADLTGARLEGARFEGADLFEVVADPDALLGVQAPAAATAEVDEADIDLHFEDPAVAISEGMVAVLWENADGEDCLTVRAMLCPFGGEARGGSVALPVPSDQVTARGIVAAPEGFTAVLFTEKPGGVEVHAFGLSAEGALTPQKPVRLGYTPVVRPILVPDGDGVLIYGIGRQGALSVHRLADGTLTERMRAPAATYRGFCGRLDPVLLGKGGTVAPVRPDGIGKLVTAPSGYPGRLTAAALRPGDERLAVAWTMREERGVRFAEVGGETVKLDGKLDIGALDVACAGDRWLCAWTRDADTTEAVAAWLPGGAPFALLKGKNVPDVEDLRLVPGAEEPHAALVTGDGELVVVRVGATGATEVARFGAP